MTETLQIEEIRILHLHEAPKLLIEWGSPWQEFVTSIGPAFSRSGRRLAGEAPHGVFPYRGMAASYLLQVLFLFVLLVLPREISKLRPYAAPKLRPYDVIYYSGDELPRTEDLGGAKSGSKGRAGGQESHHRTQTIHVARGASLVPKVADAPNLKLPSSTDAVANLLAFKSDPGPPPVEGVKSLRRSNSVAAVIAPAPGDVVNDQSRRVRSIDTVIPPAPDASAARSRNAPSLATNVVAPAPNAQSDHKLIAPLLQPSVVAPAPSASRDHALVAPRLDANIIAPASTRVAHDRGRASPSLSANVIAPAPSADGHEVAASRLRVNNVSVVPPPVSAPERDTGRTAKLNMPAPAVIAPPPSADSDRDLRRLESGGTRGSSPNVVPPPPSAANTGLVSSIIGKLFGTQDVVPPPPAVTGSGRGGPSQSAMAANVVPPPPSSATGTGRAGPGGSLNSPSGVVAPPPSLNSASGNSISGGRGRGTSPGASSVVPPPPSLAGASGDSGSGSSGRAGSNPTLLASNVVPPPPSIGSGSGPSGTGRTGVGFGGPGDAGSALGPPKGGGSSNTDNSGIVVSSQPGSKVGMPGSGSKGSLAMSPGGADKPGLGGSGGGTGIGRGDGPGSGMTGNGPGAGKTGSGVGSDTNARGGISPMPGPGGAGTSTTGVPAVPGVDVRGGSTSNIVNLPSFAESGSAPTAPGRSSVKDQQGPAITIVATSRSGGAFDFYGKLPGDNYTVYVDTNVGTVVMQFAEVAASSAQSGALVGPQGLRTELPAGLPRARVVVKCKLDTSGNLKNLQVLEPGPANMTAKIVAALPTWKFRPATRGAQPVEVNAILGFNIDTNDRY